MSEETSTSEATCPNCHHGRYLSHHKGETLNVEMDYYHCDACQKNFSAEEFPTEESEQPAVENGSDSSARKHDDESESSGSEEGLLVSDVPAGHGDGGDESV